MEGLDAPAILQADLAALWHGLDALLGWQAQAAAQAVAGGYATQVPAVQTAFLVDAGIRANLQHVTQVHPTWPPHAISSAPSFRSQRLSQTQSTLLLVNIMRLSEGGVLQGL